MDQTEKKLCDRCGIYPALKENVVLHPVFNQRVCNHCLQHYCRCKQCGSLTELKTMSSFVKPGNGLDGPYCLDCFNRLGTWCDGCARTLRHEDLSGAGGNNVYVCGGCLHEYVHCEECGGLAHRERDKHEDGSIVCLTCFRDASAPDESPSSCMGIF